MAIPSLYGQQSSLLIYDRFLQENGDTILTERDFGNWWFGATASSGYSLYFGKLSVPKKFSSVREGILDFSSGDGISYQGGITAEWQQTTQPWGISLTMNAYDFRESFTSVITENYQRIREYRAGGNYTYLGLAPAVRYRLPVLNLHLISGFNFDILTNQSGTIEQVQDFEGRKNHDIRIVNLEAKRFRYGGHIGVGADIFLGEISSDFRVRFMPFAIAEVGSGFASVNNSLWYSVVFRGGLNIKVAMNYKKSHILPLDPTYVEPPAAIASIQETRGFSIKAGKETIRIAELSYVGNSLKEEERATSPVIRTTERVPVAPEVRAPVPRIVPNQLKTFTYSTSTSTTPSKELISYLDGVAEFLKSNPRARLQIEGHSDNIGTVQEHQRNSDERAMQVVSYLMKKGIARNRLLASGLGSRRPKADNRLDIGKQQNRRVEIQVVP